MKKQFYAIATFLIFCTVLFAITRVRDLLVSVDGSSYTMVSSVSTNLHVTLENFDAAISNLNVTVQAYTSTNSLQTGTNENETTVTPRYSGDTYWCTGPNSNMLYKSTGTTTNDWVQISHSSS